MSWKNIGQKNPMLKKIIITCVFGIAVSSIANAQGLVYSPINPSFGGSAFNSSHLIGIANAQNKYQDPAVLERQNATATDLFISQLQSRLLSGLASQVTDAIFGDNPQESGKIVFGDQTITYNRGAENVFLVIEDNTNGTRTEIEIPVLTTPEAEINNVQALGLNPVTSQIQAQGGNVLDPLNIDPLGSVNTPVQ